MIIVYISTLVLKIMDILIDFYIHIDVMKQILPKAPKW